MSISSHSPVCACVLVRYIHTFACIGAADTRLNLARIVLMHTKRIDNRRTPSWEPSRVISITIIAAGVTYIYILLYKYTPIVQQLHGACVQLNSRQTFRARIGPTAKLSCGRECVGNLCAFDPSRTYQHTANNRTPPPHTMDRLCVWRHPKSLVRLSMVAG